MRTIRLHGRLGKRFGRTFRLDVATPREALCALKTIPGFEAYMIRHSEPGYRVVVGRVDRKAEQLGDPMAADDVIRIIPYICGSGVVGRVFEVIVGALLIIYGGPVGAFIGKAMVMDGLFGIVAGDPPMGTQQQQQPTQNAPSYSFNGAVNTVAQGNPVPFCYGGPLLVGSQVISAGLVAEQTT